MPPSSDPGAEAPRPWSRGHKPRAEDVSSRICVTHFCHTFLSRFRNVVVTDFVMVFVTVFVTVGITVFVTIFVTHVRHSCHDCCHLVWHQLYRPSFVSHICFLILSTCSVTRIFHICAISFDIAILCHIIVSTLSTS